MAGDSAKSTTQISFHLHTKAKFKYKFYPRLLRDRTESVASAKVEQAMIYELPSFQQFQSHCLTSWKGLRWELDLEAAPWLYCAAASEHKRRNISYELRLERIASEGKF